VALLVSTSVAVLMRLVLLRMMRPIPAAATALLLWGTVTAAATGMTRLPSTARAPLLRAALRLLCGLFGG
jgi:hypothetical protein